jgi:hypothetical protein
MQALEHTGSYSSPHFEQRVLEGLAHHSHGTVFLTTVLEAMLLLLSTGEMREKLRR